MVPMAKKSALIVERTPIEHWVGAKVYRGNFYVDADEKLYLLTKYGSATARLGFGKPEDLARQLFRDLSLPPEP